MNLKIKLTHPNAKIPERANPTDGGWDVFAAEITQESESFVIVNLGFQLEIPEGYKLKLIPRSSLTKTTWIQQNSPGLGDAAYRGDYQYRFRAIPTKIAMVFAGTDVMTLKNIYNHKFVYDKFPYQVGDRVGQICLEEVIPIEFQQVMWLTETVRGDGGFGSTGK